MHPRSRGCAARERDLEGMSATRPPQLVDARAHDEAPEPRLELGRVAQARQPLPGSQQGLLDGIASEVGVSQRQPRDSVHPGQGVSSQRRERLPITLPGSLHERSVHRLLTHCSATTCRHQHPCRSGSSRGCTFAGGSVRCPSALV